MAPVAVIAALLSVAATAWACTLFYGTMTVAGNLGGVVQTTGLRGGMLQTVSPTVTRASANLGSFVLSTGAQGNNKLPAMDYLVRFYNGAGYSTHTQWAVDCMAGGPGVTLGKVTVGTDGLITKQNGAASAPAVLFNLPGSLTPNVAPAESAVCISNANATFGNMAPLTIV